MNADRKRSHSGICDGQRQGDAKSTPEDAADRSDDRQDRPRRTIKAEAATGNRHRPSVVPAPVAALPAALTGSRTRSLRLQSPSLQRRSKRQASRSTRSGRVDSGATPDAAAAAAAQQAATPPPAGRYSGEPISVNLKDVDLRDFFRLIHEISGLNVVVDPAVKGSLTIVLDDVPWDQALDIVLKNNDLDKQLDGNVLRIATKDTMKKEADQNRESGQGASGSGRRGDHHSRSELRQGRRSGADDEEVPFVARRHAGGQPSNTLIIRDMPASAAGDSTTCFASSTASRSRWKSKRAWSRPTVRSRAKSERSWRLPWAAATAPLAAHRRSEPARSPTLRRHRSLTGTSGRQLLRPSGSDAAVDEPGRGDTDQRFELHLSRTANFALDEIITAAEERGVGKLLSKPKVITQNNQKAIVKQGTKIPVQTIVNNTVSVQFVDAVLELRRHPADHRGWHDLHGRGRDERPDRLRDPARSGHPGNRHAGIEYESADRGWRHGGDRRHDRRTSSAPTYSRCRCSAACRWWATCSNTPRSARPRRNCCSS